MQRGRALFEELNYDSTKIPGSASKGRSKILLESRNRCISYRYWYHSKRHKKRYDLVLELLSREFFLSERTLIDIIALNSDTMKDLYETNPKISALKIEYEYLIWK